MSNIHKQRNIERKKAREANRRKYTPAEKNLMIKLLADRLALTLYKMADHIAFAEYDTSIAFMDYLTEAVETMVKTEPAAVIEGAPRDFDDIRVTQRYRYLQNSVRAWLRRQIDEESAPVQTMAGLAAEAQQQEIGTNDHGQ